MPSVLVGLSKCIKLDELGAAMMKTAIEGSKTQILENADLRTVGQAALEADIGR
jgi:hypothetical protein